MGKGRPLKVADGEPGTVEYRTWYGMVVRCTNPKSPSWDRYGGRGIAVCSEWLDSYKSFREHVGKRPWWAESLDRIDNDGNYEPGNVRWATRKTQAQNHGRSPQRCSRCGSDRHKAGQCMAMRKMTYDKTATTIRSAREALGWSLEKVASEAGVSRQTVFMWETGRSRPRLNRLARVAQVLRVSIGDLVPR